MMQTILINNNDLSTSIAKNMSSLDNTQQRKISQFEKLVDNLKNNPEYKKEMFLNRLIGFYRIGNEIGTGNFSQVKLGLHLLTKEKIAVKILNKTKLDEKTQRLLLREISSMQKLHHPNIIRLYEVIHTQERLFICMEYAPEGELYTRISSDGKINELEARIIFSQIISAVDHMHSCNIIHRDIKAENIFFSNLSPINVKIGDFGFSIEADMQRQLNTYCGSPPYAAPELFRDDNYIGVYVDIWALGVLLYFIVTGIMPFKADTVGKLKRVILNGDYVIPSFVSDSCQLLIRGILKPVPADRFTIKEIMESAWLDTEKFNEELEPYQFNPLLDKNQLKLEELYSIKFLENLGITQEYFILSNINENNSSSGQNLNMRQNTLMKNLILNKQILSDATNKFELNNETKLNDINNNVYLTPELKQSINGTYRIIFHCMQKKLRKENSSELESNSYFNKEFLNLSTYSENSNRIKRINSINDTNDYTTNRKNEQAKQQDNENINYYSKSLIENHQSNKVNTNNSIFVKYNTQINNQKKYSDHTIPVASIKKNEEKNKNHNSNGFNNLNNKNNMKKAELKQSSKFCTVL